MDIKELAKKYHLNKSDFWELKRGTLSKWIITHDAVERIAKIENIIINPPQIVNSYKIHDDSPVQVQCIVAE